MITPLPGAHALKPGSAIRPFFGIDPQIVDADGALQTGNPDERNLCIAKSWPGQMRTVWGDHERFFTTSSATYPGDYVSGDASPGAAAGMSRNTARTRACLNVAGHPTAHHSATTRP